MARRNDPVRIRRARLAGARARLADLQHRGEDTTEVEGIIAELEAGLVGAPEPRYSTW